MRAFKSLLLILCVSASLALGAQSKEEREHKKHYEKWLDQDVVYIITDEERSVFSKLRTPEEKDAFIEEFWRRRAQSSNGDGGEFKEEHYRRIAYATAKFGSGIPGWKTDRGRIYIMFGQPSEIEDHSGGENYVRQPYEGGGRTAVYPFQIWRYRHLEGIGDDIEIEFVDQSWTGLYKIAQNSWEKDMLLNVDGLGETTRERLRLAKREVRPGLHPGLLNSTQARSRYGMRLKDTPFEKMIQYFALQRPPVIKQKELRGIVETHVTYSKLPLKYALNYLWMDAESALVPVTLEIDNGSLTFRQVNGIYKARVGLYGAVTGLNGRILAEFEDNIASEYIPERFLQGKSQKSMYQKSVLIPAGIYKVDLVVKDLNSGDVGSVSTNLNLPKFNRETLTATPVLLAKFIQPMDTFPDAPQSFVIGDLKVVPNVTRAYKPEDHLSLYLQIYNAGRDPTESNPALVTQYSILQGGKVLSQLTDNAGNSIVYASDQRVVMARRISLRGLAPGSYKLKVDVSDSLSGQSLSREAEFEILAP